MNMHALDPQTHLHTPARAQPTQFQIEATGLAGTATVQSVGRHAIWVTADY